MTEVDKQLLLKVIAQINESVTDDIRLMEVCGTHTHQIARLGIRTLLTPKLHLVSGPGCPVCVTESGYIDALVELLSCDNVIIATFGDLLRVRGTLQSLEQQRAAGKEVITVYSPEDVLSLARSRTDQHVIFAAVGFETTVPLYAALIQTAQMEGIENLFLLTSLKRMEPAIRFLMEDARITIDGMLCPGHVAAVTGITPFLPITKEYHIPAVVSGFEAVDIIASIGFLCEQITGRKPIQFKNLYQRCVSDHGNQTAQRCINNIFDISDATWRGMGRINNSGLTLNDKYEKFDAIKQFNLSIIEEANPMYSECDCGRILIGEITPNQCIHYGKCCTPEHPLGPCMISSEGACAAYYRYGGG